MAYTVRVQLPAGAALVSASPRPGAQDGQLLTFEVTKPAGETIEVALHFAPSPGPAGPDDWWQEPGTRKAVLRELAKLGFYWARYGMSPLGC